MIFNMLAHDRYLRRGASSVIREKMKAIAKKGFPAVARLMRFLFSPWFDPYYLRGRYFDMSIAGWRWAWRSFIWQKIFGFNRHIPWPVSPWIAISDPKNIKFDIDDIHNFQTFGCYFQNFAAQITIGSGSWIAPNVGIITSNHDIDDIDRHAPGRAVLIGSNCWIGMNSVILPGVVLGDNTVVGAGSVVTRSFPEGNCAIAGSPARIIRQLPG